MKNTLQGHIYKQRSKKDNLNTQKDILDNFSLPIIQTITKDKLPKEAIKLFEWYSARFLLPQEYKKDNFEY